ncbi:protein FAM186A [Ochotona curzoniae]|uniref:protein FAM186A n=1 Tax=Ochotona curzoniae TaxID=130825 RepID=UPI001B3523BB|nr:protein FAM186A [Ochotona curzoniae]
MQSKKDNESEFKNEFENSPNIRNPKNELDTPEITTIEIPHAVQEILRRIEQAQLLRAREDINTQLNHIMNSVQRIMSRYGSDFPLQSERALSLKERMKNQRTMFLEKMASYVRNVEMRDNTLTYILAWLEEWNAVLSDITETDIEEHYHWIVQMELFPDTLRAIENNVNILCQISTSLLKEKKKQKKKALSRGALWKTWKERAIKRPATIHALRPDQMIADQFAVTTKVTEIQTMLQELTGSGIFNKMENNAIKYISSTILNLSKALTTINDELKAINVQSSSMFVETYETEKEVSQKMIHDLSEQNEMLQQKLQAVEENYEQRIQVKDARAPREHTPLPASPAIAKDGDRDDSLSAILDYEFKDMLEKFKTKEPSAPGKKWDAALPSTFPDDTSPDVAERHRLSQEKQQGPSRLSGEIPADKIALDKEDVHPKAGSDQYESLPGKHAKGSSRARLLEDKGEDRVAGLTPDQHAAPQTPEKNRREMSPFSEVQPKTSPDSKRQPFPSTETKSQDGRSTTGGMPEKHRKPPSQPLAGKSPILQEDIEPADKHGESEASSFSESLGMTQLKHTAEIEAKTQPTATSASVGKEGKTKDKSPKADKTYSRRARVAPESVKDLDASESAGEQSNTEAFQKAIMTFLKQKIENIRKPSDRQAMRPEEDESLKTTETEQLGMIKEKIEEYFQNVTDIVTEILRKYKQQFAQKPVTSKKEVSFKPETYYQKLSTSAKSELRTFLSNDSVDPMIKNLIQTILAELESQRDTTPPSIAEKDHEKETQSPKEYLQENQEETYEEVSPPKKNRGDGRDQGQTEEDEPQRRRAKRKEEPKSSQLQEAQRHKAREDREKQKEYEETRTRVPRAARHQELRITGKREGRQKPRLEPLDRQREHMEEDHKLEEKRYEELLNAEAQTPLKSDGPPAPQGSRPTGYSQIPPQTIQSLSSIPPTSPQASPNAPLPIYQHAFLKQQAPIASETQAPMPTPTPKGVYTRGTPLMPAQLQPLRPTLAPQGVQAMGTRLTPAQLQALMPTLTPQEVQALGTAMTTQQLQALMPTLTPQEVQALGTTLTTQQLQALMPTLIPQQVQAPGTTLTPQQAQALGTTLTPQQAQALGTTLTPAQLQALMTTLTPQKVQDIGATLTPAQLQALMSTLTPQEVQALGTTLTPQQAQVLETTLTPAQLQALMHTLTPQQAQALGTTLTPQQVQALGTTLTPQEVQALGTTLTPQQAQALGTTLTPQQVQALGTTLTPQEVQALGTTLTPQQAQALGTTLTPQQAQALGTTLTPQQVQALGTTLTPQQAQALGTILTPAQLQDLGTALSPPQAKTLGKTVTTQQAQTLTTMLTPQEVQVQGTPLTPEQAQALIATLIPQQAQALGTTLTTQQAQALITTMTPQQVQATMTVLTPQQAQVLGTSLLPQEVQAPMATQTLQQAQVPGTTLTPQQAQVLGTSLTPQEVQVLMTTRTPQEVQDMENTLTPQQAQALMTALTPEQAQVLGTSLTPQEVQPLGTTLTREQVQVLETTLTPQQAQALGTTITPQQIEALETTLTPQEVQALGTTLTLQQVQTLGTTLTPQEVQAMGITLTPQQTQALGTTITSQQIEALETTLTPQEVQAVETTLTPQEAQAPTTTLIPQQVQAPMTTLATPQQVQALGTTLTPQQVQVLETTLTPQQVQVLETTLTPQQVQALGTILTPQQAQALGTTLMPQEVQAMGTPLTPQEAQAMGTPLTAQQAQALGTTLTLQQAQALGTTLTPQQVQALGTILTPQQDQAQGTTLTPQQAQALGTILTPQQAQAPTTTLTPQQAQSPMTILATPQLVQAQGTPLTPQQAHTLGTTLTPQEVQALGIHLIPEILLDLAVALPREQAVVTPEPAPTLRFPIVPRLTQTLKAAGTLQIQEGQTPLPVKQSQLFRFPRPQEQTEVAQATGATHAPMPVPAMAPPVTFVQGHSLEIPLTPEQFPVSGVPPAPGQSLELEAVSSRQLFPAKHPQTPWMPTVLKAPLTPWHTLKSELPPLSGKSSGHWVPRSPQQPLAPGASSIHGELLEAGSPALSGQPAFLPSVTAGKPPALLAPSALGQHLPRQASPPTSEHLQIPSVAEKLPKSLASSDRKKRFPSIPFLKSQSLLAQPSVSGLKTIQDPFSKRKIQISNVSDTPGETLTLKDSSATDSLRTLHFYPISDRVPVSQIPDSDERPPPTLQKPRTALPPLTLQLSRTPQMSAPPRELKSSFPSLDEPWIKTLALGKEREMMVPPPTPQEPDKVTYFVKVEAQRKNLILLNQAMQTLGLPPQLLTIARNLIVELLRTDAIRLGFFFHKYIAYRLIQRARNNIIHQIKATQNTGKGYEARNLHIMLSRIDDYQKKMMRAWAEKLKSLEEKRNQCLGKMTPLFTQLREMYKLNLSRPILLIPSKKETPASAELFKQPLQELPIEKDKLYDKKIRQQEDQLRSIWNADLSSSSYPIVEKTPVSLLWAKLGGFPDIPRLLQLDIQSTFRKSLASLKSR